MRHLRRWRRSGSEGNLVEEECDRHLLEMVLETPAAEVRLNALRCRFDGQPGYVEAHGQPPGRVRLREELRRRLSKLCGVGQDMRILALVRVAPLQRALVRVWMEEIVRGKGRSSTLLATKDEINPEVQVPDT